MQIGSICLAKCSDDLWQLATIESISDENKVNVQLKKVNTALELEFQNIIPLEMPNDRQKISNFVDDENDDDDDDCNDDDDDDKYDVDDDEDETDTSEFEYDNKKPSHSIDQPNTSKFLEQKTIINMNDFGNWEKHTRVFRNTPNDCNNCNNNSLRI
jgi:hypothetical protein